MTQIVQPIKKQNGFSLIEVMVSVVVLSLGLISLTNLQTRNVNNSTIAYAETQTMMFLQEMVEHLRIDKVAAINGDYNITMSSFGDLVTLSGTEPFPEKERYLWFNNLNNALPAAKASINCNNTALCVVEVQHDVAGATQKKTLAFIL